MSLENAILEHAGALKELAAAIRETGIAARAIGTGQPAAPAQDGDATQVLDKTAMRDAIAAAKAEKKADGAKYAAKAKDAEIEQAVAKVETDAKAEQAKVETPEANDDDALIGPLDYKTDVRPILLDVNKAKGKGALADLLKKYGAATGDKLTPESFAGIVADAKALLAA